MISGVPLFRGRDNQDQLLHIMRIIGTPDDRVLKKIANDAVLFLTPELFSKLTMRSARDHPKAVSEIPEDTVSTSPSQGIASRWVERFPGKLDCN